MTIAVDVRDLLGHPGSSREFRVEEPVEGLATELVKVTEAAPVRVDLLLESVVEGILASGTVEGGWVVTCARCLKPFDAEFRVGVRELFVPGAVPDDDDAYPVEDGSVDLEPLVRDTVIPAMPFAPLCRDDCRGLCPRCGGDRNLGECTCAEEVDPRWSALGALIDVDLNRAVGEE